MTEDAAATIATTIVQAFDGHIPQQMRAIIASWNEARVHVMCYIDGSITEDLRTEIGYVGSGIMDAFLPERRTFIEIARLDAPEPVPAPKFADSVVVFQRA